MSGKFEQLSALMDAETSEFETRRVLQKVEGDQELSDTWRRYHLARSLMKEQCIESTVDISSAVMSAVGAEEKGSGSADTSLQTASVQGFWKSAASMAVAASVTLAVLIGVQNFSGSEQSIAPMTQAGVIDRSQVRSGLMPTSLTGGQSEIATQADSLVLIQHSDDLKKALEQYQNVAMKSSLVDGESGVQVGWLPAGYQSTGTQVSDQGVMRVFTNQGRVLSVNVSSDTGVQSGVYTEGDVLAYGIIKAGKFISVVGDISLSEAQQILNSVSQVQ